ncbi:alpha/beta fold hydrolase [Blastococcus deserti]|uniref:Alpha/beta fold hydrolase n=1 Tax=Blastococcus deserti TaxID=2259033 RepID=A0ABW4X7K8_9ACTN
MTPESALACLEAGSRDAPTVVLLHGLGTSGWMWDRLVSALGDDLHLVVVDLPGHGRSRTRPWVSLHDTATAVADVVARHAAAGSAHLVGLSLGGYVAATLAAARPDLVPSALSAG